jgi:hypothetical protein
MSNSDSDEASGSLSSSAEHRDHDDSMQIESSHSSIHSVVNKKG